MTRTTCPWCDAPILVMDINVTEGVALCRKCGKLSRLADVADEDRRRHTAILEKPPRGCSQSDDGVETRLGCSCRTVTGAIVLAGVCAFWNGIVSVFVIIAFAGLYTKFVGPLPAWFPSSQQSGSGVMTTGMLLFLCLFLVPFVGIGAMIAGSLAMCIAGRIEVRVRRAEGKIVYRVGPFRWTRRFDATTVSDVRISDSKFARNEKASTPITIYADKRVSFGTVIPEERREWMCAALRVLLLNRP